MACLNVKPVHGACAWRETLVEVQYRCLSKGIALVKGCYSHCCRAHFSARPHLEGDLERVAVHAGSRQVATQFLKGVVRVLSTQFTELEANLSYHMGEVRQFQFPSRF